jgi:hypothetical protein
MERALKIIAFIIICFFLSTPVYAKPRKDERLILMWIVEKSTSDNELTFLRKKGVNLIQTFHLLQWSDEEVRHYLDRAERFGFGVIMTVQSLTMKKSDGTGYAFNYEKARSFINKWKGHPAVFAWHAFDEPAQKNISATFQEDVYSFIKSLDPKGCVFLSWNGVLMKDYRRFFSEKSFDMLGIHKYVVSSFGFRQRTQMKNFLSSRTKSYPVIITLRAFNSHRRPLLLPDSLKEQYDSYMKENTFTKNIGFYGWANSPNKGIKDVPDIMRQFRELEL